MSELLTTAVSGAAAGLGVAMPVGAIGVLLLQESMRARRPAIAAAAAVATVDLGYAALATALGPLVATALTPVEAWVRLVSSLILLTLAGHGLWRSRPPTPRAEVHAPTSPASGTRGHIPASPTSETRGHIPASPTSETRGHIPASPAFEARGRIPASPAFEARGPGRSPGKAGAERPAGVRGAAPGNGERAGWGPAPQGNGPHPSDGGPDFAPEPAPRTGNTTPTTPTRTFLRFAALTAVNPTTALYFAALTTAQGRTLAHGSAGAVFVAAAGLASLAWQQLLVFAGSFAGSRISATARAWTFRAGYGLVALYAVKIALPLP
ncbi:hypothetical protein [Streptomyces sp. NPDC093225]|uniref:hypothetical protein n=1 Tax=Streptomyces sp. NPDC093225 TaxID=3366034 RepID=UPI00380B0699